ncbi:MAG: sulfatase-like hydrolase/transferase [Alphaproteobacteria bacterium]|nr:sulfatase-like hydrolase/transferase [Alphaproteobacteria bacterium]
MTRSLCMLVLVACGGGPTAPPPPEEQPPPPPAQPEVDLGPRDVVRLDDPARITSIELPPTNLTPGRVPGITPLRQPFVRDRATSTAEVDVYRTPLPLDPLLLLADAGGRRPGSFEPRGLSLSGPQGRLPFAVTTRPGTWGWDADSLVLRASAGSPAPEARRHRISSDALAGVERGLDFQASGLAAEDFVVRTLQGGERTWSGLFLPAPGRIAWTVEVPFDAVFDAQVVLLAAPVSGSGSDGASAILEVQDPTRPDEAFELGRIDASREGTRWRVDLDEYAGRTVQLRLRTDPGLTRFYDHVLLADPVVRRREDAPTHVVVVDLGGLGAGALGVLGNPRPVSPALDALAARGAVFEQAWAPSPQGDLSLGAALTGVLPGEPVQATLAGRAREAGFATGAFVAGEVDRALDGFARTWAPSGGEAADLVKAAGAFLAEAEDRDALVVLRPHATSLPFTVAGPHRGRYAKEPWRGTPLEPTALGAVAPDAPEVTRLQDHLQGRRDQLVRTLDDELGKLLPLLRADARVVVMGDHGVELWEHGGVGAGHALVPETLRVPLVVVGPGVPPGRVAAPVSTVDLAATLLELGDLAGGPGLPGTSLLALAEGAGGVASPPVVGWPARGVGWGVVAQGALWTTTGAGERVLPLVAPTSDTDPVALPDAAVLRAAFTEATGSTLVRVADVELDLPEAADGGFTLRLSHPAGLGAAWLAGAGARDLPAPAVDGAGVVYRHPAHLAPPAAVLVELGDRPLEGLQVRVEGGGPALELVAGADGGSTGEAGRGLRVGTTAAPRPASAGTP